MAKLGETWRQICEKSFEPYNDYFLANKTHKQICNQNDRKMCWNLLYLYVCLLVVVFFVVVFDRTIESIIWIGLSFVRMTLEHEGIAWFFFYSQNELKHCTSIYQKHLNWMLTAIMFTMLTTLCSINILVRYWEICQWCDNISLYNYILFIFKHTNG